MGVADWACDGVKGKTRRLGRELNFGANVEESKVTIDEVVSDAGCFVLQMNNQYEFQPRNSVMTTYVDIDLAAQDIFRLLESVVC